MNTPVIGHAETDADIRACFPVMSQLRPHVSENELLAAVQRMRGEGYKVVALSVDGKVEAVAGYRIIEMLRTGSMLEIDDLVTSDATRSKGYGRQLFDWIHQEARHQGCSVIELDSSVHRVDAHRFYFRQRMHILAFHFSMAVT
ncbi:GNAT family N-acetyltransferase [Dyella tabacisoli]|uniref:GNAT family N-acetyltransferase n=1 Tax=Dyella tabacisoli TaxID=2282381 RepID=A0A369UK81_9GAMM|nr:GNAT family N-acetyltransferase [Dyella tabacisoli]RDD80000.1 GNAT family N-acetyltransferase [Dyella tabacisoli]